MTYKVENGEDGKDGVDPDGVLQLGCLYTHDELPVIKIFITHEVLARDS